MPDKFWNALQRILPFCTKAQHSNCSHICFIWYNENSRYEETLCDIIYWSLLNIWYSGSFVIYLFIYFKKVFTMWAFMAWVLNGFRATWGNINSDWVQIAKGVLQSLIHGLYVDDHFNRTGGNVHFYADDTILYCIANALPAVNSLQHCFTNLQVGLSDNRKYVTLVSNADKIKCLPHFHQIQKLQVQRSSPPRGL